MPHRRNRATRQLYEHNRRRVLRDATVCYWCGRPISTALPVGHPNKATADHLEPVSLGGSDELGNLVAACFRCNDTRGNKPLAEWLRVLGKGRGGTPSREW